MMAKRMFPLLAALLLGLTVGRADQIVLKNGQEYSGKFVRGDSGVVEFRILGRIESFKTAEVKGRITEAKESGRVTGKSELALELTEVTVGGKSYTMRTGEYSEVGSSRGSRTAKTAGGGAALGAIIGAIAGGGKGAAIGAA